MPRPSLLQLDDVSYRHRRRSAARLVGISLTARAGEVVHVVGENGSGKTTLLQLSAGLIAPRTGVRRSSARSVGYAATTLAAPPLITAGRFVDACAEAKGVDAAEPRELTDQLGLRPYLQTRIGELSSGTRQRVNLLQALVGSPELIILDEPFATVDEESEHIIGGLLTAAVDRGAAVLLAEHVPTTALPLRCTSVIELDDASLSIQHRSRSANGAARAVLRTTDRALLGVAALARPAVETAPGEWTLDGPHDALQLVVAQVLAGGGELVSYRAPRPSALDGHTA